MKDFSAQVMRERFAITPADGVGSPIIAMSNRAPLTLVSRDGKIIEKLVVRGHMLHTVVRMMGSLVNMFARTGSLFNPEVPMDWEQIWDISAGPHERAYNPDLWMAVYHNGKPIYQTGHPHHSFLDVIEQCDFREQGDYDQTVELAQALFNKAGKPVSIDYESMIAGTFNIGVSLGRVALMLRGAQKTTTFTYTGETRGMADHHLNPVHFINAGAAFLEGIQLAFTIGTGNEKIRRDLITPHSEEGFFISSAAARLDEINAAIKTFENLHLTHYRPEQPDFPHLIAEAEAMARQRYDDEEAATAQAADLTQENLPTDEIQDPDLSD